MNFSPGSLGVKAPMSRKVKWSASCQATFPTSRAALDFSWAASVSTPSAKVEPPAILVGGLPGPEASQLKWPSSLIARAIFASLPGAAVQFPASFLGGRRSGRGRPRRPQVARAGGLVVGDELRRKRVRRLELHGRLELLHGVLDMPLAQVLVGQHEPCMGRSGARPGRRPRARGADRCTSRRRDTFRSRSSSPSRVRPRGRRRAAQRPGRICPEQRTPGRGTRARSCHWAFA